MIVVAAPAPTIEVLLPAMFRSPIFSSRQKPISALPSVVRLYVPAGRLIVVPALAFAKMVAPRKLQSLGATVHADAVKLSSVRSTVMVANAGALTIGAALILAAGRFIRLARNAFGKVFASDAASPLFDSA